MEYIASIGSVHWLGVAAATLGMLVVCGLWVSPLLFGRAWARLTGIRPSDVRPADARRNFMASLLTSLVGAFLLGLVATHIGARTTMLYEAAAFLWLFVMLEQLHRTIWHREPIALFFIETSRSLAALMAASTVFYLWS